jgi:hypothetical protein
VHILTLAACATSISYEGAAWVAYPLFVTNNAGTQWHKLINGKKISDLAAQILRRLPADKHQHLFKAPVHTTKQQP